MRVFPLTALKTAGAFGLMAATGCATDTSSRHSPSVSDTLVIYLAASLTRPLQPVLDSFASRQGAVVHRESGGSLEHARKITELHRIPDLVLLADEEVFPQLLVPAHATWYASFARNRMVVAYTDRSKLAAEITSANWTRILQRKDVQVGRTDPTLAPAGYRTLLMLDLSERHYHQPGLAKALLANAPPRNVRANAADLAALLAAGELDYIYEYQSVAESNGFHYLTLPPEIDLGDPARAASYAVATVQVPNRERPIEYRGRPIVYALTVPTLAPHPDAARRFLALFFAEPTRRALRAAHVDLLDQPVIVGTGAPSEVHVGPHP
jgi:molybdate/tungstate transport system substrate-binding protein